MLPGLPKLSPVSNPVGVAIDGAKEIADRIQDLAGLANAPGQVEEKVIGIKKFVDRQIDSLLGGIVASVGSVVEEGRTRLQSTEDLILSEVDRVELSGERVLNRISDPSKMAKDVASEGERVSRTAKNRSDSFRRWAMRIRDRSSIPNFIEHHTEVVLLEFEDELEILAEDALRTGETAQQIGNQLAEKTGVEAGRVQAKLEAEIRERLSRASSNARQVRAKLGSLAAWASGHVKRAEAFRTKKAASLASIRSFDQAQALARDIVADAQVLAQKIGADVLQKPAEIVTFGQHKVSQAMELVKAAEQETMHARDWLQTQPTVREAAWRGLEQARNGGQLVIHRFESGVSRVLEAMKGEPASHPVKQNFLEMEREVETPPPPPTEETPRPQEDLPVPSPLQQPDLDHHLQFEVPSETPPPVDHSPAPQLPQLRLREPRAVVHDPRIKPTEPVSNLAVVKSPAVPATSPPSTTPAPLPIEQPKADVPAGAVASISPAAPQAPSTSTTAVAAKVGKSPSEALEGIKTPQVSGSNKQQQKPDKREGTPPSLDLPKAKAVDTQDKKTKPAKSRSAVSTPIHQPDRIQRANPAHSEPAGPQKQQPKQAVATPAKTALENTVQPAAAKRKTDDPADAPDISLPPSATPPSASPNPGVLRQQLVQDGGAGASPTAGMAARLAPHIDFDISLARLHTGPVAAAAARMVRADAFTIGRDIFFGANKFDPASPQGLGLIAHEMTHVGQQLGLNGDQMRFSTKTGGDAMEQEAQDVGERVATNLGHPSGLRVGKYSREYIPADDEPLTTGAEQRLDNLSMRALARAGDLIAGKMGVKPVRLDLVIVDLTIDLESSPDQEIIAEWAEAICSAVLGAQAIRSQTALRSDTKKAPPLIQRRFGNDQEIGHYAKEKQAIAAINEKLAKISATPEDKDLIRSLYLRKLLNKEIKAAKKDRSSWSISDLSILAGVSSSHLKNLKALSFGDDEAAVLAAMQEFGFSSALEYEFAEKKLIRTFVEKGIASTHYMLDENLRIIEQEIMHYWGSGSKPSANKEYHELKKAALDLNSLYKKFVAEYDRMADIENLHKKRLAGGNTYEKLPKASFGNMPNLINILRPRYFQDGQLEILIPLWQTWNTAKTGYGKKFPILLGSFDHAKIAEGDDDVKVIGQFMDHLWPIKYDIEKVKSKLDSDKFWELPKMIELTKKNLGIVPGDGADIVLSEYAQDKRDDEAMWSMIKAAATIALAIVATVATGGLAAVAMVGGTALGVHSAYTSVEAYQFKMAALNTALDEAKRISKDDPSLFWVVVDILGAALDVGAAMVAFAALSKVTKAVRAAKAAKTASKAEADAIAELHDAAKVVYKENPNLHHMSEEQFIARVFESANRGIDVTEAVTRQYKVISELLQGTTARVVAVLQGDRKALAGVVRDHGNWKGLMAALNEGGPDASKIADQIHAYREEIVGKLKDRGIRPLDDASAGRLSDYDLSVYGDETMGAGEKLIKYELEMRNTFGDGWNQALDINFYTPGNQLRAYEGAMIHASDHMKGVILERITRRAEQLNLAKMVEHAGDDVAALERVKQYIKALGKDYKIEDLQKLGKELHEFGRNKTLIIIDEKVKQLKSVPPGSARYQQLSQEISLKQMEANFLMNEAYIGPASIKQGRHTGGEIHQIAVSQLYMIEHVISMYSGDILKAVRNYEFHKYVSRYVKAAKEAGITSEALTDFERLSGFVYRQAENRSALQYTGQFPGVTGANDVVKGAVDANYIKKQYDEFMKEVQNSLPKIQKNSTSATGGKWEDQFPKSGGGGPSSPPGAPPNTPPSGGPPPTPPSGGPPPTPPSSPPTPPPGGPSHPPLPPIPPIPQHILDNIRKITKIDRSKKLSSAGFKGSAADDLGAFRARITGIDGPVVVKLYDPQNANTMLKEFDAARAAEKTGYGPKVFGKVQTDDGIGFAMEEIPGGFADDFAQMDTVAETAANQAEMFRNARNINDQTIEDVRIYGERLLEKGFYYDSNDIQGFVDGNGHWRPIDFQPVKPLAEASSIAEAQKIHDKAFRDYLNDLLDRQVEVKAMDAGETP